MQSFMLVADSDFSTSFFPIFRYVLVGLIGVCAIVMIITTLLQSSTDESGTTALTGQESYYSQNKGESKDGKLKRITTISAIVVAVSTVLYFLSFIFNG